MAITSKGNETADQTVARAKAMLSGSGSGNTSNDVAKDPMISALQDRLMGQADMISSSSSGIDDKINKAIGGVKEAQSASAQRLESAASRARNDILGTGERSVTDYSENRSGFGSQMAGLRRIVETTDKELKDLDMRKEELILAGESEAASKIADLQLNALKMKQDAMQQTFSNLMSLSNFGLALRGQQQAEKQFQLTYELNGKQFQLQKDQQSFQEKQALAGIALEFGLDMQPGDTIDSMTKKAAATGAVSQKRALEMEALRAQIANSNAQAARALDGINTGQAFDDMTAEVIARTVAGGGYDAVKVMTGLTDNQRESVAGKLTELRTKGQEEINNLAKTVSSAEELAALVDNSQYPITPDQVAVAMQYIGQDVEKKPSYVQRRISGSGKGTMQNFSEGVVGFPINVAAGASELIFGTDIPNYGFKQE